MPCHHNLETYLHEYLDGAGLANDPKAILFQTYSRATGQLTGAPLPQANAYAMIQRRAKSAGLTTRVGNHTFRATGVTAYLKNGGTLERAAQMANHASTRTTQLRRLPRPEPVIFLWVVTARPCEMGVSMSSRIRRAFLLSTSALASLYGLGGTGSAQTAVTLPTVEVVASEKKPAVAQPAPGPAQPASETPEGAASRQLAEKAKTFDALRSNLFTTIGTTSYAISHDDIQSLPQGVNQPVEKVLLEAPGVSQDSAASGLLHVRNDHANVQFRINGVMLPDGVTGFGSILETDLIGTISLVTGALPAERGIPDRDAIAIRRVNAFADVDLGLGNKRVHVLLARKSFHVELAGLAGVVAKPSLALFAGRCFPCALSDRHCVTLCFTHLTVIGFEFFVTMP
jgi:hypothetical protein